MSTIIHRNAFFLTNVPPEVAYYARKTSYSELVPVTWTEILDKRREHQAKRMQMIYGTDSIRAVRVHVRFFDQDILGGWHTYIDGIKFSEWIRRSDYGIPIQLMRFFPVLQPTLFPRRYEWEEWQEAFAKKYRRGTFCRKPRGVAYAWARCEGAYIREILKEVVITH